MELQGDQKAHSDPVAPVLAALIVMLVAAKLGSEISERLGQPAVLGELVTVLGAIVPFVLGFGASALLIRARPASQAGRVRASLSLNNAHMSVGAVHCATSVGITARVFKDLGRLQTPEAQIILGAAVIDDVLGLIVLAVVSGGISSTELGKPVQLTTLARLTGVALGFQRGGQLAGQYLVPAFCRVPANAIP